MHVEMETKMKNKIIIILLKTIGYFFQQKGEEIWEKTHDYFVPFFGWSDEWWEMIGFHPLFY
jgi:hypothetical protein